MTGRHHQVRMECLAILSFVVSFSAFATAQVCPGSVELREVYPQPSKGQIFYVTNRSGSVPKFGADRAALKYGISTFRFAEPQTTSFFDGMEGELHWERTDAMSLSEGEWLSDISGAVNSGLCQDPMRPTDSVVVYLHGFANGFDDALCRAAEIKHRARFEGTMVLFSWPASPSIKITNLVAAPSKYRHDTKMAKGSVDDLVGFLSALRNRVPADRTILVAHSMGNQVLVEALAALAPTSQEKYRAVVLLAPDLDRDAFLTHLGKLQQSAKRVVLYADIDDVALRISQSAHLGPRAGNTLILAEGLETVDITCATWNQGEWLHHADHLVGPALYDLFWNVVRDMPAKCRAERGLAYCTDQPLECQEHRCTAQSGQPGKGQFWELRDADKYYDRFALDQECQMKGYQCAKPLPDPRPLGAKQ